MENRLFVAAALLLIFGLSCASQPSQVVIEVESENHNTSSGDNTTSDFTPIKVSLYYESLCPDSIHFIEQELYPTWLSLSRFFTMDWVPYGKAQHRKTDGGSYAFRCQHGSNECKGNMIQACALSVLTAEESMKWIYCVMGDVEPHNAGPTCSNKLSINYDPIQECSNSNRGKQLLAEYGDRTHALTPRLAFVPTIIFDDVYNPDLQRRSLTDFRGVICEIVRQKQPTQTCE